MNLLQPTAIVEFVCREQKQVAPQQRRDGLHHLREKLLRCLLPTNSLQKCWKKMKIPFIYLMHRIFFSLVLTQRFENVFLNCHNWRSISRIPKSNEGVVPCVETIGFIVNTSPSLSWVMKNARSTIDKDHKLSDFYNGLWCSYFVQRVVELLFWKMTIPET
jgi:hypothetical protein